MYWWFLLGPSPITQWNVSFSATTLTIKDTIDYEVHSTISPSWMQARHVRRTVTTVMLRRSVTSCFEDSSQHFFIKSRTHSTTNLSLKSMRLSSEYLEQLQLGPHGNTHSFLCLSALVISILNTPLFNIANPSATVSFYSAKIVQSSEFKTI